MRHLSRAAARKNLAPENCRAEFPRNNAAPDRVLFSARRVSLALSHGGDRGARLPSSSLAAIERIPGSVFHSNQSLAEIARESAPVFPRARERRKQRNLPGAL